MQIKILRNLGKGLPDYKEDDVVECDEETAIGLCNRGLAQALPADIKGIPKPAAKPLPAPATERTAEQAVEEVKSYRKRERKKSTSNDE